MSLHLILGPMFSGKSTRLIEHIRAFKTLDYLMMVIKPDIDRRYTETSDICTHNQDKEECYTVPINGLESVFEKEEFKKAKVVMIEEGQFFSGLYSSVLRMLDYEKKHIYITALNGDSQRKLFGEIYLLLPLCSKIEWLQALCIRCKNGTPAIYSKRTSESSEQIYVGSKEQYEAVCFDHY
jgi:thymidine kinase